MDDLLTAVNGSAQQRPQHPVRQARRCSQPVGNNFFAQLAPNSDPYDGCVVIVESSNAPHTWEVVTVCLGNICRSPIAAAVLRAEFADAGLADRVTVRSAGTAGWHAGEPADPRTQKVLREAGYSPSHRAAVFRSHWFDSADLVLAMDRANLAALQDLARSDDEFERIRLLRSFDADLMHLPDNDSRLEVPDPYYGDDSDFDAVLGMVQRCSRGVVDYARLQL